MVSRDATTATAMPSEGWVQSVSNFIIRSRYFKIPQSFKVLFLWFGVLIVSLLCNYIEVPKSYFSQKRNALNMYFVKLAWGWTFSITGLYMLATSYVYGCGSWKKSIFHSLARLAVGTLVWYFWVNVVFHFVENLTGVCVKDGSPTLDITSKQECVKLKEGHVWDAVDISGHCFLLTFCILFIRSEVDIQLNWNQIPTHAAQYKSIGTKQLVSLKTTYRTTLPFVQGLFVANCLLVLLWEFMLLMTCIYFHTFYSKAFGAAIGIFSWMVTYNEWYKSKYFPALPGCGPLSNIFNKSKLKSS